jgi:ribonuclease E
MPTTPAQEEFLAITRKSQQAVIAAIKTWVETVKTASPRLAPLTDKLPKMPSFSLPLADRLPGREETVANAYRLGEQMLANQRKFAEDLLKLMTPLIPGNAESAPASRTSASVPESRAPESRAPESAPAKSAAKNTPASPAAKSTGAKSTGAKSTSASAAPKSTATKSTGPKRTPTRSAPKRPS